MEWNYFGKFSFFASREARTLLVGLAGLLFTATSARLATTDPSSFGVVYQFLPAPNTPFSRLIEASDGNFYGMTSSGGSYNAGAVFKMTSAGAVTILHSFNGSEGAGPDCGVH